MALKIIFWKELILCSLLLASIYVQSNLNIDFEYIIIFTTLSYIVISFAGFNFQTNLLFEDALVFNYKYLIVLSVSIFGFYLLSFGLSNLTYFLMNDGFAVENKSLSNIKVLAFIVIFPFIEELFFRKYLARTIYEAYKSFSKALWSSSLIFAIMHIFSDNGILPSLFAGLFFGYIYLKSNSFLFSLLSHIMINCLIIFLTPFLQKKLIAFDYINYTYFFLILFFIGFILTIVSLRKLKRTIYGK